MISDQINRYLIVAALLATLLVGCNGKLVATGNISSNSKNSTSSSSTSSSPTPVPTIPPVSTLQKSIKNWTTCDGTTDDALGAAAAFAAAAGGKFTLLVDCPVFIHVGADIGRAIFIDNNTAVVFSSSGKFILDNILTPTFVIANSNNITMTNWIVSYIGQYPTEGHIGYYYQNGVKIANTSQTPPSEKFTDLTLTDWLTKNRNIIFANGIHSHWVSPTNTSALFYVVGDSSNLAVSGMRATVPPGANGGAFIPMVFSFASNYKSNSTASTNVFTAQNAAVPHNISFSNMYFDGYYMGWQGNLQNATFDSIIGDRYGDVQDPDGGNAGGVGKWFAPPHLFYINANFDGDPLLLNTNITISNVTDNGIRVGHPRDLPPDPMTGEPDPNISGNALSFKIGCVTCSVTNYISKRPDGFMNLLPSKNLTMTNITASYDSSFIYSYFSGMSFPGLTYQNVTFNNFSITDTAKESAVEPVSGDWDTSSLNVVFKNFNSYITKWVGKYPIVQYFVGQGPGSLRTYYIGKTATVTSAPDREKWVFNDSVGLVFQASPVYFTSPTGGVSTLSWTTKNATSCTGAVSYGDWNGTKSPSGSEAVSVTGNRSYSLSCSGSGGTDITKVTLSPPVAL